MGNYVTRRNGGVEELDLSSNNAFHYPPKSGCYFGTHFIMGGERFETVQPEVYLFGENNDLNFLGNRPSQFPYPVPQNGEPTLTLKSLLNIRKDSIRLVRAPSCDAIKTDNKSNNASQRSATVGGDRNHPPVSVNITNAVTESKLNDVKPKKETITPAPTSAYNIEFTFDADTDCTIKIYYFAVEDNSNDSISYTTKHPDMASLSYYYKKGSDQVFCQPSHILEPAKHPDEDWLYNSEKEFLPLVIHCVADDANHLNHSHSTFCVLERVSAQAYMLKPLKQKQCIDGLTYLLQEIYGIENKYSQYAKEDDYDESGCECVICMCDFRDTLILPCRHLCLCHSCADNLRYQASNCPICRSPFRALLQIRALQRKLDSNTNTPMGANTTTVGPIQATTIATATGTNDEVETVVITPSEAPTSRALANDNDGLPAGYEAISLIEALNGQGVQRSLTPTTLDSGDGAPSIRGVSVHSLADSLYRAPQDSDTRSTLDGAPRGSFTSVDGAEGGGASEDTPISAENAMSSSSSSSMSSIAVDHVARGNDDNNGDGDATSVVVARDNDDAVTEDNNVVTEDSDLEKSFAKSTTSINANISKRSSYQSGDEHSKSILVASANSSIDCEDPPTRPSRTRRLPRL